MTMQDSPSAKIAGHDTPRWAAGLIQNAK